jgi:hypothetical protein
VIADLLIWKPQKFADFNQQSKIIDQQLFRAREEARDRRHGESSLPPAAGRWK